MRKRPAHKYRVAIEVDVSYLSNDVHDQGLYHMFDEILRTAQTECRKYRFEIADFKVDPEKEEQALRRCVERLRKNMRVGPTQEYWSKRHYNAAIDDVLDLLAPETKGK